jgi:hypothetical protein
LTILSVRDWFELSSIGPIDNRPITYRNWGELYIK